MQENNHLNTDARFEAYGNYRQAAKGLYDSLFDLVSDDDFNKCASLFYLLDSNGRLVFDNETDMERFAEFMVHDHEDRAGMSVIQKMIESPQYERLDQLEKSILQVKLSAKTSLYAIDEVKRDENLICLRDLFHKNEKIELTDLNLSQTLSPYIAYMATRVMRFPNFCCTAGAIYLFRKNKIRKVREKLPKIAKKVPIKSYSASVTVALYYLNQQYGEKVELS